MPSVPQPNSPLTLLAGLEQISPAYLKENYLRGVDFVDSAGAALADRIYTQHINRAAAIFERRTLVKVVRRTITDEPHDYDARDYHQWAFIQLYEYPVVSVEQVRGQWPIAANPVFFPKEWVRLLPEKGQVQLVPTVGTLSTILIGQTGMILPLINDKGYLPHFWRVDYTTGFADGQLPLDFVDAICKQAVLDFLRVEGDSMLPPGVQSISGGIDGVSQSVSIRPDIFPRITSYYRDLYGDPQTGYKGMYAEIREQSRGLMSVVA